jgi:hypothetical protein
VQDSCEDCNGLEVYGASLKGQTMARTVADQFAEILAAAGVKMALLATA